MPSRLSKNRGFTLVEMVLTIAFLSLIVPAAAFLFQPVLDIWTIDSPRNDISNATAYALSRMTSEIAQIKDPASVAIAASQEFQFTDVSDNNITYRLDGTNLLRNNDVLARDVQALAFIYFDVNNASLATPRVAPDATDIWRVSISMTCAREGQQISMETQVRPRNLPRS
jgi:prepilin-type N-terminal cleavage/methylation domain-containing protein